MLSASEDEATDTHTDRSVRTGGRGVSVLFFRRRRMETWHGGCRLLVYSEDRQMLQMLKTVRLLWQAVEVLTHAH